MIVKLPNTQTKISENAASYSSAVLRRNCQTAFRAVCLPFARRFAPFLVSWPDSSPLDLLLFQVGQVSTLGPAKPNADRRSVNAFSRCTYVPPVHVCSCRYFDLRVMCVQQPRGGRDDRGTVWVPYLSHSFACLPLCALVQATLAFLAECKANCRLGTQCQQAGTGMCACGGRSGGGGAGSQYCCAAPLVLHLSLDGGRGGRAVARHAAAQAAVWAALQLLFPHCYPTPLQNQGMAMREEISTRLPAFERLPTLAAMRSLRRPLLLFAPAESYSLLSFPTTLSQSHTAPRTACASTVRVADANLHGDSHQRPDLVLPPPSPRPPLSVASATSTRLFNTVECIAHPTELLCNPWMDTGSLRRLPALCLQQYQVCCMPACPFAALCLACSDDLKLIHSLGVPCPRFPPLRPSLPPRWVTRWKRAMCV